MFTGMMSGTLYIKKALLYRLKRTCKSSFRLGVQSAECGHLSIIAVHVLCIASEQDQTPIVSFSSDPLL